MKLPDSISSSFTSAISGQSPETPVVSYSQLKDAVCSKDTEELSNLLSSPTFDDRARKGELRELLQIAVREENRQATELLVTQNPEYEFINHIAYDTEPYNGRTVLSEAAISGSVEMVSALADLGADLDQYDVNSMTALVHAVDAGQLSTTKVLLDRGAAFRQFDHFGRLAYNLTQISRNAPLLRLLVENGLDVNIHYHDGSTELSRAAEFRDLARIRVLIDAGADINTKDHNGHTLLYGAVLDRNFDLIDLLVKAGADGTIKIGYSRITALQQAVAYGDVEVINTFSAAGADIAAHGGKAILSQKIGCKDDWKIVEALIAAGADVNDRDTAEFHGNTALISSARYGRLSAMRALYAAGADIHTRNNDGFTALMLAAQHDKLSLVKALHVRGGNINDKFLGMSALMLALQSKSHRTATYLIEMGAEVNDTHNHDELTPLMYCVRADGIALSLLLESGADINATDKYGNTPLMHALLSDNEFSVFELMAAGANIHVRNNAGFTALLLASSGQSADVVKELLARGADVSARNDAGLNALDMAEVQDVRNLLAAAIMRAPARRHAATSASRFLTDRG